MPSFVIVKQDTTEIISRYMHDTCLEDDTCTDRHYQVPETYDVKTVAIVSFDEDSQPVWTVDSERVSQHEQDAWDNVRRTRDQYLRDSDWTQMPDVHMDDLTKQQWVDYRQLLRDIPQNITDPVAFSSWPDIPQ